MPSSPLTHAVAQPDRASRLMDLLATVPDPRDPRGVRYPLAGVLAVAVTAVLAGARSFAAIGEWAADLPGQDLARIRLSSSPDESTLRKLFARVDADRLDRVLGAWLWTRSDVLHGQRVIALDGKTVRGARTATRTAPHLCRRARPHQRNRTRAGRHRREEQRNPSGTRPARVFRPHGAVVTVDAMHTQSETAVAITSAGGHYVFTVKGNTPTLHRQLKALPWKDVPAHSATVTSHGRRATRTIKAVTAPTWVSFAAAAQVAQIRRTVTRAGKKSVEVVYLITSADHTAAPPATLAAWVQGHWAIENKLHWVRDVTFDEDRSTVRTGHAPRIMATPRNTAISLLRLDGWTNIAQALRHHARDTERALTHLLTC